MALVPLLLLPYSLESQALSATTFNYIQGTAPYLTFDGGVTKVTKTEDLLGIKLSDGRTFTLQNNSSSPTAPIELPNVGDTLADIEMIVPPSSNSININDLVAQGKWRDDDGDGQGTNGVTATGSISLAIKDKNGSTVNRSDTLSLCNAPYKVTLSSTGGNLATQYGEPRSSTFSGGTAEYYITLPSPPVICAVRPNLHYGTGRYAGPANIWNPYKGFLVQSTNPSSYDRNFPTTGADGLYFDLLIAGVDASQLSWTVNTRGSLGATVSRVGSNTRVTLNGPKASSSQISSSNPGLLTRPVLPQTFELVGRDSSGNEVRYGFKLKQWFVHRGDEYGTVSAQTAWCNSLGYRMPAVSDLTNAVRRASPPISGAAPSSSDNNYQRHIGAGFFTEWGSMDNYTDAGFVYNNYWTSDATGSYQFTVYSYFGYVYNDSASYSTYAVCTAP
ncbi:hypothetical protein [Gilliamella sp. Bim1-2]|uniref:hypothetical protein n=1 Tax=Gilliamella sp. Bim1-2 TaxID=3120234 RepID=UPI001C3FFB54|nr:hypothetical protein [Gilliamella apicola]